MSVAAGEPEINAQRITKRWSHVAHVTAFAFFIIVTLVATMAPHAAAQGCAMCYRNAASSGAQGRAALRHGILILLLPALSLFLGIFFLIYCRRDPA